MKNYYRLLFKVLVPALICFICTILLNNNLDFYPLLFALVIGFFNKDKHKLKFQFGILIGVIVCYLAYGLGILSFGVFKPIGEFIENNTNIIVSSETLSVLSYIISPFIISPVITFFGYKYVFLIPRTKTTLWIIAISLIILV